MSGIVQIGRRADWEAGFASVETHAALEGGPTAGEDSPFGLVACDP